MIGVVTDPDLAQLAAANRSGVAVLIPCFNEEASIQKVVSDFRAALPSADIYVYDNNSTDRTAELARAAGATVRTETRQGKGNVVRRMFADIDAEVYVMADGDDTYDSACAAALVRKLVEDQLDMVTGTRVTDWDSYRPGHRFGNVLLTTIVRVVFGPHATDMLSGYRVFSRRFVKTFPMLSGGFEIETELTVHALEMRMPLGEVKTQYKDRSEGSVSKLSTFKDGFKILGLIGRLVKEERPLQFFSGIASLLFLLAIGIATPIILTYYETGLVPRFPTAILATGLVVVSFLSLACGLILDTVTRGRREAKRIAYLGQKAPDPTLLGALVS